MSRTLHSDGQTALISALIAARKCAGMTQTDLAKRLRCHQSFIARIESGQRRIDVPELVVLCRALGADPIKVLQVVSAAVSDDARL